MWGNSQKYQEEWILVSSLKSGSPILLDPGHPKLYHEAGPVRTLPQAHRTLTCTGVPWTECSIPGTGLGQPLSTRCSWCCYWRKPRAVPAPLHPVSKSCLVYGTNKAKVFTANPVRVYLAISAWMVGGALFLWSKLKEGEFSRHRKCLDAEEQNSANF